MTTKIKEELIEKRDKLAENLSAHDAIKGLRHCYKEGFNAAAGIMLAREDCLVHAVEKIPFIDTDPALGRVRGVLVDLGYRKEPE